jgi:sulfur carrier protein
MTITLTVNGEEREFAEFTTATELLILLGLPDKGVAIAVDGSVHPRSRWGEVLHDGSRIEVLTAVQGG